MLDLLHLSNPAHDDTRTGDSTDMVALDDALRYTVHGVETAESENLIDLTISRQRWYRDIHVSWLLTEHALAVFAGHWTHLTNCLLTRLGVTPVELDSVENFFLNFHAIPTIHVPHFDTGARQLLLSRGYKTSDRQKSSFTHLMTFQPLTPMPVSNLCHSGTYRRGSKPWHSMEGSVLDAWSRAPSSPP